MKSKETLVTKNGKWGLTDLEKEDLAVWEKLSLDLPHCKGGGELGADLPKAYLVAFQLESILCPILRHDHRHLLTIKMVIRSVCAVLTAADVSSQSQSSTRSHKRLRTSCESSA
jgi:hypothetical protein